MVAVKAHLKIEIKKQKNENKKNMQDEKAHMKQLIDNKK